MCGNGLHLVGATWLSVVLIAAALGACESSPPNAAPTTPTPSASEKVKGLDGIVLQDARRGAPLGGACHQDQECQQPLRCSANACSIPPAVLGSDSEEAPKIVLAAGTESEVEVSLEVADTPFEVQRGLMFRTVMARDWGMLFVFGADARRSFWMRNTYLPLDMIFIHSTGSVVGIQENAAPLEEGPRYGSGGPARYVLEVNAGFVKQHGVKVGQRVALIDVPGTHDPLIER